MPDLAHSGQVGGIPLQLQCPLLSAHLNPTLNHYMCSLKPSLAFHTHSQVSDILKHVLLAHSHILLEDDAMSRSSTGNQDSSNLDPLLTICVTLAMSVHPMGFSFSHFKMRG